MTDSNGSVVLVDDDRICMPRALREFERQKIDFQYFQEADSCLAFAQCNPEVALFFIDVIIPSQMKYSRRETDDFFTTGLFLARDIREIYSNHPIVFLSGAADADLVSKIKTTAEELGDCWYLPKTILIKDSALAEIVTLYFKHGTGALARQRHFWQVVWECVTLQPNVFGIGINLNQLMESLYDRFNR